MAQPQDDEMMEEGKKEAEMTRALANESLQEQEKPLEEGETNQQDNKSIQTSNAYNTSKTQDKDATGCKEQAQAHKASQQAEQAQVNNVSQELAKNYPTKVSPKEWQKHHNNWLTVVMRNMIGNPKPPAIPDYMLTFQSSNHDPTWILMWHWSRTM